ncbi:uncharacterized protein E0L32_001298 [Thyridium curvatum]|uniref:Uncharacterized protein n=1 Tax=Thyridium curvatum TaxID=1093900 RepID=A0A507AZ22_9PEZI|nr:uncharacterized protein E0L32_001298 [Thyridium curvatum]TPX10101.1 hypothetical protein E0L32_001298 [Thyridium curvatum]
MNGTDQQPEDVPDVAPIYEPQVNYGTMESSTDDVPTYTETDEASLEARIERAKAHELAPLELPLTEGLPSPLGNMGDDPSPELRTAFFERYHLAIDIINAFYEAIRLRRDDQVESMVRSGLVSPDVRGTQGDRPLLAAVRAGNPAMILTLARLGADPALMGRDSYLEPLRAPLHLAAQRGSLAAVRVLIEDLGADDALVAPDGEIALRLAARGGHREVVDYLPSRRTGGWRRWKAAHEREMRVVGDAAMGIVLFCKFFAWSVPKFVVYTAPRHMWKERKRFGRWCKRQVVEFPRRAKRAASAVARGIKEIPALIKEIPNMVKKAFKAVSKGAKVVIDWIVEGVTKVANAVAYVFNRAVSFIHTVVMALINFFKRITLKDVWDGLVIVFKSLFVDVPKAIWTFILKFGRTSLKVLEALFGIIGTIIWYLGYGIFWLVKFIPTRIWKILSALVRLIGEGFHELLVWYDPKRV